MNLRGVSSKTYFLSSRVSETPVVSEHPLVVLGLVVYIWAFWSFEREVLLARVGKKNSPLDSKTVGVAMVLQTTPHGEPHGA